MTEIANQTWREIVASTKDVLGPDKRVCRVAGHALWFIYLSQVTFVIEGIKEHFRHHGGKKKSAKNATDPIASVSRSKGKSGL